MRAPRLWHIGIVCTSIVLVALMLLNATGMALVGGLVTLFAFLVTWLAIGNRAWWSNRHSLALTVATILLIGIGSAFTPVFAFLLSFANPLFWTIAMSLRRAVIANVALILAAAGGVMIYVGGNAIAIMQVATFALLALVFSVALGLWFSRVYGMARERQRLIHQLEAAQQQLAAMSRDAGATTERERLARELHDTIAQELTGLVMTLQRSRRAVDAGNVVAAADQLAVLEENARHALSETRALVASGAAVGVDSEGLGSALVRLGERFERETGLAVTVSVAGPITLDRDGEVVLLRCAQEAVATVRKNSEATAVTLAISEGPGGVSLSVFDNGTGFPAEPGSGFGLAGMRERLALAGGSLTVGSTPEGGASITATLPAAAV